MKRWPAASGRWFAVASLAIVLSAQATEEAPSGNRGHVAINYQFVHVNGFEATTGRVDIGTTDSHALDFDVSYAVTDRWTISVGLPLIMKRYNGPAPHDPDSIVPPADQKNIDDGEFRTRFQDIHFGASYRAWGTRNISVSPFFSYGVPSGDYAFFGHAAVGQNLRRFTVGAEVQYFPSLSYWYFRLAPSYEFVEQTKGVNIDHWRITGEVGYYFTDHIAIKTFAIVKEGNGLDFPEDFPPPRNDDFWFNHDRMVRHNFVNAGLGVDWQLNPIHRLNLSWMTMIHADQVHLMKYAFTAGWSRSF